MSIFVAACAQAGNSAGAAACDQLQDTLAEAGTAGSDLAYLLEQTLGREDLCASALRQARTSLDGNLAAMIGADATSTALLIKVAASKFSRFPVKTADPAAVSGNADSSLDASSQASPGGDADLTVDPEEAGPLEVDADSLSGSPESDAVDTEPGPLPVPSPATDPTSTAVSAPTPEPTPAATPATRPRITGSYSNIPASSHRRKLPSAGSRGHIARPWPASSRRSRPTRRRNWRSVACGQWRPPTRP